MVAADGGELGGAAADVRCRAGLELGVKELVGRFIALRVPDFVVQALGDGRRAQQAEQTRTDVLLAAIRLFGQNGWAGTTLAAIAAEAGVAVETIYTGFPAKKALLRAAMDVAIVGDAQPVPLMEREEIQQLRHLPAEQRLPALMRLAAGVYNDRLSGVWSAMLEAAASDPEVAAWCAEHEKRRRETLRELLQIALEHPIPDPLLDAAWILTSPDTYTKLATQHGWTRSMWQDTMTEAIRRLAT